MKKNENTPAFPMVYDGEKAESFCNDGLTKLEYFTAKALPCCYMGVGHEEESAKRAIAIAIITLNQLNKY